MYIYVISKDQLRKEKTYIMGWVAKKMCSGKEAQPEYVLAYLKLLVPAAEADAFIKCVFHYVKDAQLKLLVRSNY